MSTTSPSSVVTTEILRNLFLACADDMNAALIRSAYSPIIYEGKDCSVALLDENGDVLAHSSGLPIFLGNLEVCVKHTVAERGLDDIHEGDAFILNDPYIQGAHTNDMTVFAPIFYEGELVGWAANRAHWLDVGAKDPGGAMNSTSVYQEGMRAGPTKVYSRYEPVTDVLALWKLNSRFPDLLMGDLNAQVTACRTGAQRFCRAIERFGLDTIRAARDAIYQQSAQLEREAIAKIPDGVYRASGQLDNDGVTDEPVRLAVEVTIDGDRMKVDLTGSAGPAEGPINCGYAQTVSAVRVAYKRLVNPNRKPDGGSFSTLEVVVPPNTLLSAEEPAACQWYFSPLGLLIDLITKALAPALPEVVAGAHYGDSMIIALTGRDDTRGGKPFYSIEPTPGGWGAWSTGDGESGLINAVSGLFKDIPVEVFENKYPIRITRTGLRPNSGGPGKFRGGCGIRRTYVVDVDTCLYLWFERSTDPAWGLEGGASGQGPRVEVRGSVSHDNLLKANDLRLRAGDELTTMTGGGGGYGDPFERDPELVLSDVLDGLVDREAAERDYGVVLSADGRSVDEQATAERRKTRA